MIFNSGGGGKEKITNAQTITVVANEDILVGDTVYTVSGDFSLYTCHESHVTGMDYVFSPNGNLAIGTTITPDEHIITLTMSDGMYDLASPIDVAGIGSGTVCVAFSYDSSLLIIGGTNETRLYSVSPDTLAVEFLYTFGMDTTGAISYGGAKCAAFSRDGKWLATVERDYANVIRLFTIEEGSITIYSDARPGDMMDESCAFISDVSFFTDSSTVMAICKDIESETYAMCYSLSSPIRLIIMKNLYNSSYDPVVSHSADGKLFAIAGDVGVSVYPVDEDLGMIYDGQHLSVPSVFSDMITDIAFSPDNRFLAICVCTGEAFLYSVSENTVSFYSSLSDVLESKDEAYETLYVSISPDSRHMFVVNNSGFFYYYASDIAIQAPSGIIAPGGPGTFPFGFAKTDAAAGEEVTVKTIGEIKLREEITFTISGTSYFALEDMTWEDWVDSDYNDGNYRNTGTSISNNVSGGTVTGPNGSVLLTDLIIENYNYTQAASGGSD